MLERLRRPRFLVDDTGVRERTARGVSMLNRRGSGLENGIGEGAASDSSPAALSSSSSIAPPLSYGSCSPSPKSTGSMERRGTPIWESRMSSSARNGQVHTLGTQRSFTPSSAAPAPFHYFSPVFSSLWSATRHSMKHKHDTHHPSPHRRPRCRSQRTRRCCRDYPRPC